MLVDMTGLPHRLRQKVDDILRGRVDQQLLAAAERARQRAAFMRLFPPAAADGFGEQVLEIDPVHDAYWRQCYGHDYTENPDLLRWLAKRNEEIRVRSRGTKIMVGWAPGSESKRPAQVKIRSPKSEEPEGN